LYRDKKVVGVFVRFSCAFSHKELELFFAEGNTILNEQTIIQKKEAQ
jgi:hypothetical protein